MRCLALLAFLLMASVAYADPLITITLSGAGAANSTQALTLTPANGARVVAWAQQHFGPVVVPPASTDPTLCATVPTPAACLPTTRPMTSKEAVDATFLSFFVRLRESVVVTERATAGKNASDAVVPIPDQ